MKLNCNIYNLFLITSKKCFLNSAFIVNCYVNILFLLVRWGLPWARNTSKEVVVALALSFSWFNSFTLRMAGKNNHPCPRVFIKQQRSQNSPANIEEPMTIFHSDVEPLSEYFSVTLHLSPATRVLNENVAVQNSHWNQSGVIGLDFHQLAEY